MQFKIHTMSTKKQATHSALPYCHLFGGIERANCSVSPLSSSSVTYTELWPIPRHTFICQTTDKEKRIYALLMNLLLNEKSKEIYIYIYLP